MNGSQLKAEIKAQNKVQQEIARELCISKSQLSAFLNGRATLNKSKYYQLHDLLGISIYY